MPVVLLCLLGITLHVGSLPHFVGKPREGSSEISNVTERPADEGEAAPMMRGTTLSDATAGGNAPRKQEVCSRQCLRVCNVRSRRHTWWDVLRNGPGDGSDRELVRGAMMGISLSRMYCNPDPNTYVSSVLLSSSY